MLPRRSSVESGNGVFLIEDAVGSLPQAKQLVSELGAVQFKVPGKTEELESRLQTDEEVDSVRRKLLHVPLGQFRILPDGDISMIITAAKERLRALKQRKTFRTTIDRINLQLSPGSVAEPGELRRLTISDRYRASILANAADAIMSVDKRGFVTAWNRSAEELFQVTNAEGRLFEELPLGECGPLLTRDIRAVFEGKTVPRQEIRCRVGGQKRIEIESTFAPVLDDDGAVIGVSIIARDVSAGNRARRLLQVEHLVTRHLVEAGSPDEVIRRVLETIAHEVNASVGEFWNLDRSKEHLVCAAAWSDPRFQNLAGFGECSRDLQLRHGEGLPGRVWETAAIVTIPDLSKDNNFPRRDIAARVGLISALAFPIATESEFIGVMNFFSDAPLSADDLLLQMMRAVGNDIAQYIHRVRAEQTSLESAERMRFMAESMPQKIFTANAKGDVDYFNQQWMEFTGLTFEQIRNWGWTQFIHPDDLEENLRRWKRSLETGEPFEFEHRFRRKDGVYRWHLSRARAMHDASGKVLMWIGSNTDIDDQKRAEERLETIVAERTAKLRETVAELEGFSYSISHDMRAPLRAMQQYAEILLQEQSGHLTGEGPKQLERIMVAANRLDQLIQDILTYSRMSREELPLASVDVDKLVRELIDHYPAFQKPAADVQIEGRLLPMVGHEAALTQCISNLIANAVKFVPHGTVPRVRIWTEERDDKVRFSVQDNGVGISEKDQKRIFEIFVRVYPDKTYSGTGIGLSIVRKAIQRMGGNVGVESTQGKGSTFWIELKRG